MSPRRLRILYISQYYPPEIGATQTRAREMVSFLAGKGHRVTVLTEFPNHPLGVIPGEYRGKWLQRDPGVPEVVRVRVYARPRKNSFTRLGLYLSFMFMAIFAGLTLRRKYDLIYATSPPLFVAAAGWLIAALRRCRFFLEIRDLWPESAVALGELRHCAAVAASSSLESFLYRRAVHVVAVTRGIADGLGKCGVADEKITLIPNGADLELYLPAEKDRAVLEEWGLTPSDFVVIYTGLMGLMHGAEVIPEAAERMSNSHPDVHFVLIGEGVLKEKLIGAVQRAGLRNVIFVPAKPERQLPRYIQSSDAGLVTTRNIPLCRGSLPVKMFSYMACAIPVLLAADGEARELVDRAGAGLCVEPENADQLVRSILQLKSNPQAGRRMGQNGRRLVQQRFSRKELAAGLEALLVREMTE